MPKSSDNRYSKDAIEKLDADFISAECLDKLGLDQNPFIDHARDPFIFIDSQLEMSMNVLVDYLANQNSTLVLLGELGIGKTTYLRMLLRKGYQQFNFCTLRAKPKITFSEIEDKIRERWKLPQSIDEDISLLDIDSNEYLTTDEHIKKYIEDDKNPVLIIDDAHRLQSNVLDELLKLKHHVGLQSSKPLGLVLASEPILQTQLSELEHTNPAATQIYQINVRPFDAEQCKEYIEYRVETASAKNNALFSDDKLTKIYTHSKGLPKYINKLAREEISALCMKKRKTIASPTNQFTSSPSMRLGLILAGLVGLAVLFAALSNNPDKATESVELELNKPRIQQEEVKDSQLGPDDVLQSKQSNKPIAKPYVAPLVLGPMQKEPTNTSTETDNVSVMAKPEETVEPKQKKESQKPQKQKSTNNYSSEWILKQDPNAYTIQMVASPSEENLLNFAKKNALVKNTAFYKKTAADKNWYVLVHGAYPSRDEALSNIEKLSEVLKKNSPYPVQIKYLQEVIRQQ